MELEANRFSALLREPDALAQKKPVTTSLALCGVSPDVRGGFGSTWKEWFCKCPEQLEHTSAGGAYQNGEPVAGNGALEKVSLDEDRKFIAVNRIGVAA
jgi:hypothetical protein